MGSRLGLALLYAVPNQYGGNECLRRVQRMYLLTGPAGESSDSRGLSKEADMSFQQGISALRIRTPMIMTPSNPRFPQNRD